MPHPLSRKQMEVLKALEGFAKKQGYIPSVRELAARLRKSPTTVFQHLKALERRGYVKGDGAAHGWRVVQSSKVPLETTASGAWSSAPAAQVREPVPSRIESASRLESDEPGASREQEWIRVPVAGTIAAGAPIEAVEDTTETYSLPRSMVPDGAFALRVRGDSMIEDHILDGDLVIVRPQEVVRDGEVAVALLPDGSATLKRLFREKGRVRLQPANDEMEPIYAKDVRVQGKVVGVWRGSV